MPETTRSQKKPYRAENPPKISDPAERVAAIRRAGRRIRTKERIDFLREVRGR